MRLIRQPTGWSCFPTALAMCIDRSVEEVLAAIGHDGSQIIWPEESEPFNRRSFHDVEIYQAAWSFGYAVTEFPRDRMSLLSRSDKEFALPDIDLRTYLSTCDGILIGEGLSKLPHAVAWDWRNSIILDPNGSFYKLEDFKYSAFYAVTRIVK